MNGRSIIAVAAATTVGAVTTLAWTQEAQRPRNGMPDLVGGLRQIEGCIGVETAGTRSGKRVIFAWFTDKAAVERWYYSEPHMAAIDMVVQGGAGDFAASKPLAHVPDGTGPIMVVASITPTDTPAFGGLDMPVSQIAIELYQPLPGGAFLGGRFAPAGFEVPDMKDLTPVNPPGEAP